MENKALVWNGVNLTEHVYVDSYEFLHSAVDGYIEHIPTELEKFNIDVWCNEEGKLRGLEPTLLLTHNGVVYDTVVGNVVFTRFNDEGETLPLTKDDIKRIATVFNKADYYIVGTELGTFKSIPAISY